MTQYFTVLSLVAIMCTIRFTIQQFYEYIQSTEVLLFGTDLRTNGDYVHNQHWRINFYNQKGECSLRGTNWTFKYTVIPRLTSDPANEFSANEDFFTVFRTRLTNMDSANKCFSGWAR